MKRKKLKKLLMSKRLRRNLAEWISFAGPRAADSVAAYWDSIEPMFHEEYWKGARQQ